MSEDVNKEKSANLPEKQNNQGQNYKKEAEPAKPTELELLEIENKKLEIAAKKLELLEREANLVDVKERLAEREAKRVDKFDKARNNGVTLAQNVASRKSLQERCNHHKGGQGEAGIVNGQGDDSQYAVIKHKFLNGDTWIVCLRCKKTWKPPVKKNFTNDKGVLNERAYQEAWTIYREALNFQTRNHASSGYVFSFSDGGEFFRETMENVNLT